MNISQIILMLMNSANTLEREVVCNDDFDGNDDVSEAIENVRNAALSLKSLTGVNSKAKAKREEHARAIEAIMNTNVSNKEFQYFFAFTASEKDSIHCYGCSDVFFDANLAGELASRAARHMAFTEDFMDFLSNCVNGDDDDD